MLRGLIEGDQDVCAVTNESHSPRYELLNVPTIHADVDVFLLPFRR